MSNEFIRHNISQNHFNILLRSVLGKVKVKFTQAQAMKAHRGRGIALLFI
jgi:hypothetical protein